MTINELRLPNPDDMVTYPKIRLYRAPDVAGAPGAFASIVVIAADTSAEASNYRDTGGALTSWYKHRGEDAGVTVFTDDSTPIQFGDYLARQWVKKELADTDLADNVLWDMWRDQVIQEMRLAGLGRAADSQSLTLSSSTDEWHALNADIRRVTRMELYNSGGERLTAWNSWEQRGRQVRIFLPRGAYPTAYTWKVYGIGELHCLSDLLFDDELHLILKWGMKAYYAGWRKHQRLDLRPFMARTKQSDVTSTRDFAAVEMDSRKVFYDLIEKTLVTQGMGGYGSGVV